MEVAFPYCLGRLTDFSFPVDTRPVFSLGAIGGALGARRVRARREVDPSVSQLAILLGSHSPVQMHGARVFAMQFVVSLGIRRHSTRLQFDVVGFKVVPVARELRLVPRHSSKPSFAFQLQLQSRLNDHLHGNHITMTSSKPPAVLERVHELPKHGIIPPSKKINDGDDLSFFFASTAYSDLTKWLLQLNRAIFPTKREDGGTDACTVNSSPAFSEDIEKVRLILQRLSGFIEEAPPDTGPRRFGNVAFRKWYQLAEDSSTTLLESHILGTSRLAIADSSQKKALCDELKAYLLGSLGSSQRLDYGTGHELSFLAFLGCLWKLGMFNAGEERAIVIGIIQP